MGYIHGTVADDRNDGTAITSYRPKLARIHLKPSPFQPHYRIRYVMNKILANDLGENFFGNVTCGERVDFLQRFLSREWDGRFYTFLAQQQLDFSEYLFKRSFAVLNGNMRRSESRKSRNLKTFFGQPLSGTSRFGVLAIALALFTMINKTNMVYDNTSSIMPSG